jgi:hypothetical protein
MIDRSWPVLKRVGYGGVLWLIPYAAAFPLLGLSQTDPAFFKSIMIVLGGLIGFILSVHYFLATKRAYLREGILLAITWIAVNWLRDIFALLPFTGQTLPRYFEEIGLRYIAIVAPTVALGFVLGRKLERQGRSGEASWD